MTDAERIASLEAELAEYQGQLGNAREELAAAAKVIDDKERDLEQARRNHQVQEEKIAALISERADDGIPAPIMTGAQEEELDTLRREYAALEQRLRDVIGLNGRREEEIAISRRTISRLRRSSAPLG